MTVAPDWLAEYRELERMTFWERALYERAKVAEARVKQLEKALIVFFPPQESPDE